MLTACTGLATWRGPCRDGRWNGWGAIGGVAGEWAGGGLGGIIGGLFGPEGIIPGALIGRRLGRVAGSYGGRAAAEWAAAHMSHADEKADEGKAAASDQTDSCSTCKPPPKPPNKRHDPCKVKKNSHTKDQNTMIDPDLSEQVKRDVDAIRNGQVAKRGDGWIVNGRSYGQHEGALYPKSGPGLVQLPNRLQHQLLGQLNSKSYEDAMQFADNLKSRSLMSEEEFQQVMSL